MWFLYMIVVLYLFTPYPAGPSLFVNWSLSYVSYFFLGYLITIIDASAAARCCGRRWCCRLPRPQSDAACWRATGRWTAAATATSVMVIPMSISASLKQCNKPFTSSDAARELSRPTLGVDLIHPIVCETLSDFVVRPFDYQPALAMPLLTIAVYASSLANARAIAKTPCMNRTTQRPHWTARCLAPSRCSRNAHSTICRAASTICGRGNSLWLTAILDTSGMAVSNGSAIAK